MPPYTARLNAWNYAYRGGVSFFAVIICDRGNAECFAEAYQQNLKNKNIKITT
jgi:hypothetical protein